LYRAVLCNDFDADIYDKGDWKGLGPKKQIFLRPKMAMSEASALWAQEVQAPYKKHLLW